MVVFDIAHNIFVAVVAMAGIADVLLLLLLNSADVAMLIRRLGATRIQRFVTIQIQRFGATQI